MQLLDPDIADCRSLVIDANPTSRSTLVSMLRDWGVGTVAQASRPIDARKILEERIFDIGVNWYMNRNVKLQVHQSWVSVDRGSATARTNQSQDLGITGVRLQFSN